MLQCSAMEVNTQVVTVGMSNPYAYGKWWGEGVDAACAAYWYTNKADMIEFLTGYLENHTQDTHHKAASMLLDQLTLPQDDCGSYEEWRFGL